jgi:cellulose synthase/poly-beta-1,6-N-acetylglucosamine synthase-like glycosyltransferase
MCLARTIVERFPWNPASPAEDHEFHMRLLAAGVKVSFAPDAHVYSQMPGSLRTARSQNVRWERGKIELMCRYSPGLLVSGIRSGDWSRIDGALELIMPPFSLTFGLAVVLLGVSLWVGSFPATVLGLFNVGAQALYTVRGLAIMPMHSARLYLALLYAPWFILWKTGVYLAVALGDGRGQWVRTTRSAD